MPTRQPAAPPGALRQRVAGHLDRLRGATPGLEPAPAYPVAVSRALHGLAATVEENKGMPGPLIRQP